MTTWTMRLASVADAAALSEFVCDSKTDCAACAPDGGNRHEREIEDYVRTKAINELAWRGPHVDHRLILLLDPSGEIAAVAAHEVRELEQGGVELSARLLVVAAVRLDLRGTSVDGQRLSSRLLSEVVHDLAANPPEFLWARVAECNDRSAAVLARHRIDEELSSADDGYQRLIGLFENVKASVPDQLTA